MSNDYDPFDNEDQEEKQKEQSLQDRLQAKEEANDFLFLMRRAEGRRFIWRLLTWTHVFRSSFTGNSETFFREGERNVGCRLMNEIHTHCPDLYLTMVKEQKNDRRNDSDGNT